MVERFVHIEEAVGSSPTVSTEGGDRIPIERWNFHNIKLPYFAGHCHILPKVADIVLTLLWWIIFVKMVE